MKTKRFLLAAVALTLVASCSKNDVNVEINTNKEVCEGAVNFGIANLDNATRASKVAGNSFVSGDKMAVYGFQDTDNLLFNKQEVTNVGEIIWSYSPLKYWQSGSEYKFYAIYPYSVAHTFNTSLTAASHYFEIGSFKVENDPDNQVDLMIAKEYYGVPFNTVDFIFNHILSNVNFYFKASSSFPFLGVSSIEVLNFDVTGLSSTAKYTQTAWDATTKMAVGSWSSHSGVYDFPEVTSGSIDDAADVCNLATDLLLMPQAIADAARLQITYRINYTDNTSATYTKGVRLADIKGKLRSTGVTSVIDTWAPNYIYNYTLTVNPAESNVVWGSSDYDGTIGDDEVVNSSVVIDEDGNYWVDIDDDGAGDYPIVWEDIDGDNFKEGGVDMDGDGHIDNVDDDLVITSGTESDNKHIGPTDTRDDAAHQGEDATLVYTGNEPTGDDDPEHPKTQLEKPGDDNGEEIVPDPDDHFDPDNPYNPDSKYNKIDWNGSIENDGHPSATLVADPSREGEYMVDIDNDGVGEYHVVWEDIDGDGVLEGGVDRNDDGLIDDVDEDGNVITPSTMHSERLDQGPTDEIAYNTSHKDVILIDFDGDYQHIAETQLERIPADDTRSNVIEFSATVEDWIDAYDASVNVPN